MGSCHKIYVNRAPNFGPYGGGAKFINALFAHAKMTPRLSEADTWLIAGIDAEVENGCPSLEHMLSARRTSTTQLAIRVNDCDARKGTNHVDKILLAASEHVDTTFFVSRWMMEHFLKKGWKCQDNHVLINGVDKDLFKPAPKLNDGKVNIVTAHWSDNKMKGEYMNEWLDSFVAENTDFTFTYIGRTKAKLPNSRVIAPLVAQDLGAELAKYDVCVNASMFDPAPNAVIESVSCGVPTYVAHNGGGCIELAGIDHVYHSIEELRDILLKRDFKKNSTEFGDWKTCIERCVQLLV